MSNLYEVSAAFSDSRCIFCERRSFIPFTEEIIDLLSSFKVRSGDNSLWVYKDTKTRCLDRQSIKIKISDEIDKYYVKVDHMKVLIFILSKLITNNDCSIDGINTIDNNVRICIEEYKTLTKNKSSKYYIKQKILNICEHYKNIEVEFKKNHLYKFRKVIDSYRLINDDNSLCIDIRINTNFAKHVLNSIYFKLSNNIFTLKDSAIVEANLYVILCSKCCSGYYANDSQCKIKLDALVDKLHVVMNNENEVKYSKSYVGNLKKYISNRILDGFKHLQENQCIKKYEIRGVRNGVIRNPANMKYRDIMKNQVYFEI